jgi:hypothetical protein
MDIDMAIANSQPYAHPEYIEALAQLLIHNFIVLHYSPQVIMVGSNTIPDPSRNVTR